MRGAIVEGARLLGCCEGDSKPAHAKPADAAPKISLRGCRPPAVWRRAIREAARANFTSLIFAVPLGLLVWGLGTPSTRVLG